MLLNGAKANGPRDRRDRIEHAQVVALSTFAFRATASDRFMQPSHETSDMRWAEQRVGPERAKGAYAWRQCRKFGCAPGIWTDYDVEPISPFRGCMHVLRASYRMAAERWLAAARENFDRGLHSRLYERLRLRRILWKERKGN